jgi:eukaryotic-like serine/threonine-protein kinase
MVEDEDPRLAATEASSPAARRDGAGPITPGLELHGYRIESLRGEGGFASVFRATRIASGETVAFKALHPHLGTSRVVLGRFQREIETITRLRHHNIVDVSDSGELSPGRPFYVMEWLEGKSLDEEIETHGLFSIAEVLQLLDELGSALYAAHESGIVHRDIKASNIMLATTPEGPVTKLLDFGIAKLVDGDPQPGAGLTSTGSQIGTPYYMAPEQILCGAIDKRTDIYALGVLLFQLLTGKMPFTATTAIEIIDKHINTPPPRASDFGPVPVEISAIIQKCLAKQPDDRFESVAELFATLRAAASTDAIKRRTGAIKAVTVDQVVTLTVKTEVDNADDVEDAVFDDLEAVIAIARGSLSADGFEIDASTGNLIAASRKLPPDPEAAAGIRRSAIQRALELSKSLGSRASRQPGVKVYVFASVGEPGKAHEVDLPLLADTLVTSRELATGLDAAFVIEAAGPGDAVKISAR